MMQSFLFIVLCIVFFGCSSKLKPSEFTYPFTAKYSSNWQPGNEKNAVLVLNCFKKYDDGDVKGVFADIADSLEFIADKFHFTGSKDSLEAMMTPMRADLISMSFVADTWLTIYYPDKNETWVKLWSTEK